MYTVLLQKTASYLMITIKRSINRRCAVGRIGPSFRTRSDREVRGLARCVPRMIASIGHDSSQID